MDETHQKTMAKIQLGYRTKPRLLCLNTGWKQRNCQPSLRKTSSKRDISENMKLEILLYVSSLPITSGKPMKPGTLQRRRFFISMNFEFQTSGTLTPPAPPPPHPTLNTRKTESEINFWFFWSVGIPTMARVRSSLHSQKNCSLRP